jgi:hypothetical protein
LAVISVFQKLLLISAPCGGLIRAEQRQQSGRLVRILARAAISVYAEMAALRLALFHLNFSDNTGLTAWPNRADGWAVLFVAVDNALVSHVA